MGTPGCPPGTCLEPGPSPGCTSLSPSSICRWVLTTSKGSVSTAATCGVQRGVPAQCQLCCHLPAPPQSLRGPIPPGEPQHPKLTVPEMAPDVKLTVKVAPSSQGCLQSHVLTSS